MLCDLKCFSVFTVLHFFCISVQYDFHFYASQHNIQYLKHCIEVHVLKSCLPVWTYWCFQHFAKTKLCGALVVLQRSYCVWNWKFVAKRLQTSKSHGSHLAYCNPHTYRIYKQNKWLEDWAKLMLQLFPSDLVSEMSPCGVSQRITHHESENKTRQISDSVGRYLEMQNDSGPNWFIHFHLLLNTSWTVTWWCAEVSAAAALCLLHYSL